MRDAELTRRARDMRKGMTEPESRLWLELRGGRFHGIKFRRQKDIGRVEYTAVTDDEALEPFQLLCRTEGIIPTLEPSHADRHSRESGQGDGQAGDHPREFVRAR